jgi:titin
MSRLLVLLGWCVFASAVFAAGPAVFQVTTTRDAGLGSLREALNNVNRAGGPASIVFSIPKTDPGFDAAVGTWTITLLDTPPPLTASHVVIDGTPQGTLRKGGNSPRPVIVLNGNGHTVEYALCLLNASHCTIRGMVIGEFIYGIQIYGKGSHHNVVAGNHLGIDATGSKAFGNYNGVELISGAHDNIIGGANPADGNLISGNEHIGLKISDAHRNVVIGNRIGLDVTASRAVPNYDGICIEGRASSNRVGGAATGERNIISGNVAYGVDLFGWGVTSNTVVGNFIGTDHAGLKAIPNTYGVLFDDRAHDNTVGGLAEGEGNLISGNTAFGAYCYNNGTRANVIRGNLIGTDITGRRALPNETGVHIDGGTVDNVVDRNVISGNIVAGITLFAVNTDRNRITRNRIGTAFDGVSPLGNGADGVRIAFGPKDNVIGGSDAEGNVIACNGHLAIQIESAPGNRISGNTVTNRTAQH